MTCKITYWVDEETVTGEIGNDWSYSVIARVYNPTLLGAGEIKQPEHRLDPGSSQPPPNHERIELPAGECGTSPSILLILSATEVDWLVDDKGTNQMVVVLQCPEPGGAALVREVDIAVRVGESPRILAFFKGDATANLTVKVKLELACE
jgi:hypothetical protein